MTPDSKAGPRHTARGIVVRGDQLLLMERWRDTLHYFSIPGGGIEVGETPQQTVVREIWEEAAIKIAVEREVLMMRDGPVEHHIYLCQYIEGEPFLDPSAPEAQHGADNRFEPGWVAIGSLDERPFLYWQPVKQALIHGVRNGFGDRVVIVEAPN